MGTRESKKYHNINNICYNSLINVVNLYTK